MANSKQRNDVNRQPSTANRLTNYDLRLTALLGSQSGIALVVVIALMVILLSITGAALLFSGLNLKTASNVKTGGGAIHAADAGIQHALSIIPSGTTFSYSIDVNNPTCVIPSTSCSTTKYDFSGGYAYTVTATNDSASTNGNSRAILISSATGPNSSNRKVRAYIGRSSTSWAPPGTIYIPGGSSSDADFNTGGSSFRIDGNDTNYSADSNNDGRADSISSGPKSPVYGVAALYDSMVTEFNNSLNSTEKTQVQGKDYNGATSPATPSVFKTTNSFSVTDLANTFKAQGYVQPPGISWTSATCPTPPPVPMSASCVLGTDANPQITYINGSTGTIKFDTNSTVVGSGVLILDGKANIFGNFEFHGIVISLAAGPRGDESTEDKLKLKLKDNARIFGAVLLGPTGDDLKFDIKGSAAIRYSSQAINLIQNNPFWAPLLPQPPRLLAWHEVMQ